MASTIKLKNGSGAPTTGDLVQGEPALDLTNKRLYTENASGVVIEVGTSPSTIDINAGTIDGTVIGGSTAAAGTFTTISASGEIAANGGIALGDNDKATFGASDDLQIYHDGSGSYIDDVGTGNLFVRADNLQLRRADGSQIYLAANTGAEVALYHAGNSKLATTATGIDVTGTATMDGLTVSGSGAVGSFDRTDANAIIELKRSGSVQGYIGASTGGDIILYNASAAQKLRAADNGDISFYEDTGTTAKFFWDASAESLGVGASPSYPFHVTGNGDTVAAVTAGASSIAALNLGNSTNLADGGIRYDNGADALILRASNAEAMRISSGNLLIGYTSSNGAYKLQVNSQIFATSATIATSDGRYKENVEPLSGALDLVAQLNPVQFDWKEHPVHNFDRDSSTVGFIAQEVQSVLADKPYLNSIVKRNECVIEPEETDDDGNVIKEAVTEEFFGIAEGNMVALLTKAIQELKAEFDAYKEAHP